MSIDFRTEKFGIHTNAIWDTSDNKYKKYSTGSSASYDILQDDSEVDDCIVWGQSNGSGGQYWKIEFNITEAVNASQWDGVWEVRYSTTSRYNDSWNEVTVINDGTNKLQNSGTQIFEFAIPDNAYWTNDGNPRGQLNWYDWDLRFRITSIGSVTAKGHMTDIYTYADRIVIDNEDLTMEDIYQADISNGWGKVFKSGETTYTSTTGIYIKDNSTFTSKNESITFIHNHMPFFRCNCNFGELTSSGKPVNGTTIRCECSNADYNSCYLGGGNSTYYDLTIKFSGTSINSYTQGFWGGGVGYYSNQKIKGGSFSGFRSYAFSNTSNIISGLTYSGTFTEPAGATMFDMVSVSSSAVVRPNTALSDCSIHRFDCTDITSSTTNPWRVSKIDGWRFRLVDCKINYDFPIANFYVNSGDTFYEDCKVLVVNSFQSKISDSSSNPIDNVLVSVFDKNNILVNSMTSNEDGYIGVNKGVTSNSSTDTLESTSYDMSNSRFKEILITNGDAKGNRAIIHNNNSDSSVTLAEPCNVAFAEGDRFVEIPYIIYRSQSVKSDGTSGYEPLVDLGTFRVSYRKYGYVFSDDALSFDTPIVSLKGLNVNIFTTLSKVDVSGLTGISIDGIEKSITITEEHSGSEIYDYAESWSTQVDNLVYDEPIKTFDGSNYSLTDGWVLILQSKVSGQFNISGNLKLTTALDLDDININGNLHVLLGTNGTLNFSNISAIVYNDDTAHTLTINASGGSNLIASVSGTANGETNIVQSVTLTISGLKANSEVRLYDSDLNEIGGVENSSNSESFSYSQVYNNAILVIHHIEYQPIRIQLDLVMADSTLPIQQVIDRNYNNPI